MVAQSFAPAEVDNAAATHLAILNEDPCNSSLEYGQLCKTVKVENDKEFHVYFSLLGYKPHTSSVFRNVA